MTGILKDVDIIMYGTSIFLECLMKATKASVNIVGAGQHFSLASYETCSPYFCHKLHFPADKTDKSCYVPATGP
jgi:hypothetical protein